nr:hypothetical protein [Tanacetum cinerariifolium]
MGNKGKAGSSQNNIDDKGYWDSGCSRHMTGNISYLFYYEPFDEGYVSFSQGGCKITGKGTIKTGKLEFKNVYFVKELKYNLFSVSQICDNKNNVLFTNSECIMLERDFKLLDDANVLLRTPRQHNMYSIDLNNIVPHKDLTCIVATASTDEGMLWHRRLGHLNFKTINRKFITEIENLKDLKVKIIKCDNGGEFRNKEMDYFCSQKEIKKEFSNARTPQQNGVAERINRTLIEAARTMLADAKLPVTFWAEEVNTACYVQNMVLVNKSHNKTLYELFNGKFEAKGDEGYFIRYSMSSKAFKVFNKRTKRVEENLHVEFLENKAIKKGAYPNWLFDIDSLTKSMNYVPVVAGTNSTNLSGTKDATSQEVKKDVSSLRYIALSNWVHDALLESSSSKPQDDCSTDVPESSRNSNPTATSTNPSADQVETLTVETPIPTVSSPVLTTCFTDSQEPSNILRVTTNSDESNGVEADVSNMETTITASPTPTLRIHKDHPKIQIIGPVDTPIQTRNKSKEMGEHNKARLVAQGHTQEEGIDYDEVFAPVARIETIKLFLAYASFMGFTVYQMKDLEFPARVYKVEKAMYGLHQAPRAWKRGDFILVQVYVDDIIFGSSNPQLCREFEALMHEKFQMSAMGELNFFFGLQVLQKEDDIFLSQDKYVDDILKKFRYSDVRSANTLMDKEKPWGKDGTGKDVDLHLYRSMIGSLMYLTASRPDIMFAVCACARHQVTPKECHLHAVNMIFRYLKGHPKLGLWYPKESPFDFVAYSDSDYGGATQDRKLTTGGCQFFGRRLILWQCKKQTIVATSTTEA